MSKSLNLNTLVYWKAICMLHGHHELKGTHHELDRTGRSKKLSDLDGFMGRCADSAAARPGRELTAVRASSTIILIYSAANLALKNCIYIPQTKACFAKSIPAQKELHMLAKCAN